jgi:hypothetical protein
MKRLILAALVAGCAVDGFAAALTAERDTPQRSGESISATMASNVIIYAGGMVALDSNGLAAPAADTAGHKVIGRARATVDNRTAVYSAAKTIAIDRGVFRWANADAIVAADIGQLAYVTDDQTVNQTGGGQAIIAGAIVDVDAVGVWVDTGKIGPSGAATPSSLAVAGNGTVGGTLAVTGASTLTGNTALGGTLSVAGTSLLVGNSIVAGTLTGSNAITSATSIQAPQIRVGATTNYFQVVGTALQFVCGGVTNVIDADITAAE